MPAFLERGTRRPHLTGAAAHPAGRWAVQQARSLAADFGTRMESLRFMLRGRDTKYTEAFDAVFPSGDADVLLSAPRAPRTNAHCERVIGTIRREAPDHVLIVTEAPARRALGRYQDHYNGHRPHQARDQLPPDVSEEPAVERRHGHPGKLLRTRILGGAINEYRYAA
ncbi:integrase core domain-containing protein [Streptomyces viridosporus]|uniref:integrase core domain-containing protein n=1 Tax=Streptomyces viridosporus TaxID=67581 RepID=UPI00332DD96F